jgi:cytochrome c oxidase subunit 2
MTVENWAFVPASVSVKKGERVVIRLTNTSGVHSFMSSDLGLNVAIQAGETKDIEIPTDETGTFSFRCGVPCGPGHMDMKGSIVVG